MNNVYLDDMLKDQHEIKSKNANFPNVTLEY